MGELPSGTVCAIDTEADSLHRYKESLCLIQFAVGENSVLIDPLALEHMSPLGEFLKTAAVWNVGLATIGALIGAGGYGDSILAGIRRMDTPLILQGAIPAIILALLVQVFFDILERWIVSPGLRYGRERRA